MDRCMEIRWEILQKLNLGLQKKTFSIGFGILLIFSSKKPFVLFSSFYLQCSKHFSSYFVLSFLMNIFLHLLFSPIKQMLVVVLEHVNSNRSLLIVFLSSTFFFFHFLTTNILFYFYYLKQSFFATHLNSHWTYFFYLFFSLSHLFAIFLDSLFFRLAIFFTDVSVIFYWKFYDYILFYFVKELFFHSSMFTLLFFSK